MLALVCVLAGACLGGRTLYLNAKAALAEILIRRAWAHSCASGTTTAPWPWADTYPIARMRIPRIGYDEMVLEGATPRTLAFGPARMLSGAAFGGHGNVVLAGHRTSWFRPLQFVGPGDQVEIEWFDRGRKIHRENYVVDGIRIVDANDTSLLTSTSDDVLTLITCYPFGASPLSPQRYIVRALPVQNQLALHALGEDSRTVLPFRG